MEPAEQIVNTYLHSRGYFSMPNIKVGLRELDILAVHPGRKPSLHVEVQVSVDPLGQLRPWSPLRFAKRPLDWRIKTLCDHNFVGDVDKQTGTLRNRRIEEAASELLGRTDYDRVFVVGRLHDGDSLTALRQEFRKNGVEILAFGDVVAALGKSRGQGVHMDEARRYFELFETFFVRRSGKR